MDSTLPLRPARTSRARLLRRICHSRGVMASPPLVLAALCTWRETEAPEVLWPAAAALVAAYVAAVPRWAPRGRSLREALGRAPYLARALLVELPCLLVLAPYVAKELLAS